MTITTELETLRIPLAMDESAGIDRAYEPVVVGVPFARGQVDDLARFQVRGVNGSAVAYQCKVLGFWDDGSIKWVSVSFDASVKAKNSAQFELVVLEEPVDQQPHSSGSANAGSTMFGDLGGLVESVRLSCTTRNGNNHIACTNNPRGVETEGRHHRRLRVDGGFGPSERLEFTSRLTNYPTSARLRLEITIKNPSRAQHPDGYWDLGDPGSVLLDDLTLEVKVAVGDHPSIHWQEQPHVETQTIEQGRLEIYQESSGGENWKSANHVNHSGDVPMSLCGYRVRTPDHESLGKRASPVVAISGSVGTIACSVEDFWQRFPTALEVNADCLRIGILPWQFGDAHELQAGEHLTCVIWFADVADSDPCKSLSWIHSPLDVHCGVDQYAESAAIPFLPKGSFTPRAELDSLSKDALEGRNNLFAKREVIDEYGWRHFGDVWADHEKEHFTGRAPVISHYNNQYDLLHSFLVQYLLTGDRRWKELATPLARHLMDIDVYHAEHDRAAYCGGMFWHTAHYHDVGTCTHRAMSQTMLGKAMPAPGGGPGSEHNYGRGLLLYHFLTGDPRAKQTVLGLADWVIAMDAGDQHMLGVASSSPTGIASSTREPTFHGPGRGAGNSINALLDGWLAGRERKYLDKAEEIICRTIHPQDEMDQLGLGDAENRWSYTVYLQALVRFLEVTSEHDSRSSLRSYIQASLLHYARWMEQHETLYLDNPEQLEFPTETWAAQDLRKGNVLLMVAPYAAADEAERFRRRGEEILDGAWAYLGSYDSRTWTRPLAVAFQQGYLETYFRHAEMDCGRYVKEPSEDFGAPVNFVAQKQRIKSNLKSPLGLLSMAGHALRVKRWLNIWRRSWLAEKKRRIMGDKW